ncbi:MAG: pilus assembly protein PilM [Planctomycetes bacterium]|nr:pilus assembly protein PilM [Planctomycetota bacterium]
MALRIVKGRNLPIGVDLGTSTVKLAQLRQNEEGYELLAGAATEIPRKYRQDPARRQQFLIQTIRQMMKTKPFRGRQCVLSIPAEETFVQHLKMPPLESDLITQALREELSGKLPYSVDDAVIRHVVAGELPGETGGHKEVIAICAQRAALESYLAVSRRSGLDVIAINVEPCAVVECFARLFRRRADAARTILYVDMGYQSTQVVFAHGNQIAFARNLRMGGETFENAIAQGLKVPTEEAESLRRSVLDDKPRGASEKEIYDLIAEPLATLNNELNTCMRYYESVFRNRSIERAIFLGGQAYDKRLCQSLAQQLNLPAQVGDPLVRIKRSNRNSDSDEAYGDVDQRHPQPDWAVAVGLSLGAMVA